MLRSRAEVIDLEGWHYELLHGQRKKGGSCWAKESVITRVILGCSQAEDRIRLRAEARGTIILMAVGMGLLTRIGCYFLEICVTGVVPSII